MRLYTLKATTCLIDGETVTCTEAGLADFEGLRNRRGDGHLCTFDLLEVDGRDLRNEALAISIPRTETTMIRHFQERMPYELFVP